MNINISMVNAALIITLAIATILFLYFARENRRINKAIKDVIDSFPFGVVIGTHRPYLVRCNKDVVDTLGLTPVGIRHKALFDVRDNSLLESICGELFDLPLDNEQPPRTFDIIDQKAQYRRWERHVSSYPVRGRAVPVVVLTDRTEAAQLALRLEQSSSHDALTGLANRDLFHDRLHQALETAPRNGSMTAVLVIEMDGFGQLVDQQGWETARRVLTEMAGRIAATTRASDTVARVGQSEFAVLLTNIPGAATALHAARRFLDAVRMPALSPGNTTLPPVPISGSIGLAIAPRDGATSLRLLDNATLACRRAQRFGGAQVLSYDATLDGGEAPGAEYAAEMRRGLEGGSFSSSINRSLRSTPDTSSRSKHCCDGVIPCADLFRSSNSSQPPNSSA